MVGLALLAGFDLLYLINDTMGTVLDRAVATHFSFDGIILANETVRLDANSFLLLREVSLITFSADCDVFLLSADVAVIWALLA